MLVLTRFMLSIQQCVRQVYFKKLFKIYLLHSFMLFTTLFSSNYRYIVTAIRLKLEEKIATK